MKVCKFLLKFAELGWRQRNFSAYQHFVCMCIWFQWQNDFFIIVRWEENWVWTEINRSPQTLYRWEWSYQLTPILLPQIYEDKLSVKVMILIRHSIYGPNKIKSQELRLTILYRGFIYSAARTKSKVLRISAYNDPKVQYTRLTTLLNCNLMRYIHFLIWFIFTVQEYFKIHADSMNVSIKNAITDARMPVILRYFQRTAHADFLCLDYFKAIFPSCIFWPWSRFKLEGACWKFEWWHEFSFTPTILFIRYCICFQNIENLAIQITLSHHILLIAHAVGLKLKIFEQLMTDRSEVEMLVK